MKILFVNLPYMGHIVPTVGLVQELTALGCQVTYLLPFGWEDAIAGSGAVFCGYKSHAQLSEQIREAYRAAEERIGEFDYLVYEQFFFLGKHLAEKHGKPAARVFTAPATNQALMQEFIRKGPMSLFRHKWIARAFTRDAARGILLKTDNWLDEIVSNPPELNLVYTLRAFQPCAEDFPEPRYVFLGPSLYQRAPAAFDFVKADRPLVYISLGTVLKGSPSFFASCMDAFREENVDVILSTGRAFDSRKLKNIPENFHVFPFVPQPLVLEMADVFITHGGMNSINEAFVSGTPMVVIPFVSDQPVNAQQVEALGAGRVLLPRDVTPERLRRAVFSLLEDEAVRASLRRIRQSIDAAPGNRGGAERILAHYRQHI